jgi:hypothetical protein
MPLTTLIMTGCKRWSMISPVLICVWLQMVGAKAYCIQGQSFMWKQGHGFFSLMWESRQKCCQGTQHHGCHFPSLARFLHATLAMTMILSYKDLLKLDTLQLPALEAWDREAEERWEGREPLCHKLGQAAVVCPPLQLNMLPGPWGSAFLARR